MEATDAAAVWRLTYQDAGELPGQRRGLPAPLLELPVPANAPLIRLPDPALATPAPLDFLQLVNARRSHRAYRPEPLALAELSYLLWCTQGVQKVEPGIRTMRTVPSAGARHAFETLALVNDVEGLAPGMYRFVASQHALVDLQFKPERIERMIDGFRNVNLLLQSAVVLLWIAVVERMTWKFGARGHRYLLLDAGHICQNLYLACGSIGCGTCAIGSFDDEEVNAALGLDGEQQLLVYAASVGKLP